ncbi:MULTISPECIES: FDLD family class I lanthipeptide [unclassified Streptomyces]|uniref:FDLD family class I lanthipeptide n=1 Tax=unclassified Streptomyces TaxID=2593676 RepID=UPI00214CAB80|nr:MULTISPECIES: FDLD family class I lanthipeptide [unclassified Streptomyces]MCX5612429.1 FDLD family class I lanthipeptide [Streptomyces sp. NBC_00047]UUU40178.1 FDLD family class I lanthipeptide [Streptomyces sp. NBC_00162]
MSVSLVEPVVQDHGLDDFDLDVRIAVSSDIPSIEGGFSNWYSCKGTCASYCCDQEATLITCAVC